MRFGWFKTFKKFKPFNPHLFPPPRRGGGVGGGFERLKRLELFELLERFSLCNSPHQAVDFPRLR